MFDISQQPLGFVEPRYDEIDGLSWAWCGGSDHVQRITGALAPIYGSLFAGWENAGAANADCMTFTPDRAVPMTSGEDWALEYVGRFVSRSISGVSCSFIAVGNADFTAGAIGIGAVANSGGFGIATAQTGFQGYNSGLAPGSALHHFILSRYRGRMWGWMLRYDTGAVTRVEDVAPPSNAMTVTGSPVITLLRPNHASATFVGNIHKAAVYNRGMVGAEAESLLRDPWQTFRPQRPRQRLTTILDVAAPTFNPAWAAGSNRYIGGGVYVS